MKTPGMKYRIAFLSIFVLCSAGTLRSQGFPIVPFAKIQGGYGSFLGYTDADLSPVTIGTFLEQPTYRIFGGFDYGLCLGGSVLKDGNDVWDESFFDFFLVHKRLSGSSNAVGYTGLGVQARYRFFYGGFTLGLTGNRNELPLDVDDNNQGLTFGDLHGPVPMFTLGLRAPLNAEHTLFLDIPFDFAIPRNRTKDMPEGDAAIYEWYSFSIGICYHLFQ
jgi:hypothetical protein